MQELQKKILVIEDDARTRNIFLGCLEDEGFCTIGAENGVVGIQQAQEQLPDLVICDILMPEMDGYGVLTTLRQNPVTAIIPLIFLTASVSRDELRKGMELGANDYLTKPSTIDELLRAIATQLEKQAIMRCWYATQSQVVPAVPPDTPTVALASIFPSVPQLKEVFDFIEANYHLGITLCDVAEVVGYSPAYLTNLVGKQTGQTVNSWIVDRRMTGARSLLQNTDQTVEQIATALGYQNACHFSRQFRQHHQIPPQAWRKEHQLVQKVPVMKK